MSRLKSILFVAGGGSWDSSISAAESRRQQGKNKRQQPTSRIFKVELRLLRGFTLIHSFPALFPLPFNRSNKVGCLSREPQCDSRRSNKCRIGGTCYDPHCRYKDARRCPVPALERGISCRGWSHGWSAVWG